MVRFIHASHMLVTKLILWNKQLWLVI